MNLLKISIQNMKIKPLYTFLSIFILALSIALLLGVQQLKNSFEHQIKNNLAGVDLVIGAKGSPLQLVLSSVLHLDNPTGNIPYDEAQKIRKNPMVKKAVPISYGDNYRGYRIVGTTPEFITLYGASLQKGNPVQKPMEVVLGYLVAERLHLNIGDTFLSSHGLIENEIDVHSDELTVVGILTPTQRVIDRLIITNLESIWQVHDHDDHDEEEEAEEHAEDHDHDDHDGEEEAKEHVQGDDHDNHNSHDQHQEEKEITSLLILFRNPSALLTFPRNINKNTNMQAALPKYELDRLYQFLGVGFKTVSWIAYLILIISGLTIFISLYKMVKERAFDLALLRTYGASNVQLIKIRTYEGLLIIGFAFVVGFFVLKIALHYILNVLDGTKQQNILQNLPFEQLLYPVSLVLLITILSILLAIRPIMKMSISSILSREK